ncbi:hypothetical protein IFM89_002786 [Coptis chinensis]|uniref:Uncharacterized protein n=1 Tax=Coptis chinensis TaxID=261450 RepID=A0A835HQV2_9MAGN|nr:hypothetical protein IFM89_002786 [Coptis chinensis]
MKEEKDQLEQDVRLHMSRPTWVFSGIQGAMDGAKGMIREAIGEKLHVSYSSPSGTIIYIANLGCSDAMISALWILTMLNVPNLIAYVDALRVLGFVIGGVTMYYLDEEQIHISDNLNFDYTKSIISIIMSCPSVSCGLNCKENIELEKYVGSRVIAPNQNLNLPISLKLPESDYNQKLGDSRSLSGSRDANHSNAPETDRQNLAFRELSRPTLISRTGYLTAHRLRSANRSRPSPVLFFYKPRPKHN